jgi:DtxR family Mn-dependent transcriptional regulator
VSEPQEPRLTDAAQGYLLTLRSMSAAGVAPMTTSLARRMGVSKQAGSQMVGRLVAEGLVSIGKTRELSLTDRGRRTADVIFRRHALLEWLLTQVIGLGWAESDEEAMRLQGAVSPRVEAAIDALLGHPPTCPHGNPIDAASAAQRPTGVPLSEMPAGADLTVYRITEEAEEDAELLVYLEQHGLVPGAHARVREHSVARDAITLDGPRGTGTMGLRPAALIRVLPGRADESLFHRVPDGVGLTSRPVRATADSGSTTPR